MPPLSTKIPKLSFAELPASIATLLKPKYERLGYLGEFFARTAHQEAALKAFIEFTDAAKGSLGDNVVELIALTVASMKGVDYEKNQHERLAVKLGMSREWVADVERLAPAQATPPSASCRRTSSPRSNAMAAMSARCSMRWSIRSATRTPWPS
jgi:alkylhydroperoxidase family enzyme